MEAEVELPIVAWDEAALRKEDKLWKPKIFYLGLGLSEPNYLQKLISQLKSPSEDLIASDGALVPFDVSLNSSFNWNDQLQALELLKALGKKAFIYLDFGFGKSLSSLEDSGLFMSLGLGIDQLSAFVLSKYQVVIEAAFLTWNAQSFSELISWTPALERDFYDTLPGKELSADPLKLQAQPLSNDARFYLELFSKERVTNYFNFLITQLPAHLPVCVHFSSSEHLNFDSSPLRLHILFERRSMGSAFLAWSETALKSDKGLYAGPYGELPVTLIDEPVTVGILLPELKKALEFETLYADALRMLREKGVGIRCIPSEVFHEEWHLIDEAVGVSAALTYEAFRQLVGFSVSGGRYLYLDAPSPHLDDEAQESFSKALSSCN